jgi:hypothetical protein
MESSLPSPGVFRSYTAGPTPQQPRTLRRETRSISGWREKGKYKPFDLSRAVGTQLDRAATWHGPQRRLDWDVLTTESVSDSSESEDEEEACRQDSMVRHNVDCAPAKKGGVRVELEFPKPGGGYFSIAPQHRSMTTVEITIRGEEEMFEEEPLSEDVSDQVREDSKRRSIDLERQPLVLGDEEKHMEQVVADVIKAFAGPSLNPAAGVVKRKVERVVDDAPSPEEIIEPKPTSKSALTSAASGRAGEVTPPIEESETTTIPTAKGRWEAVRRKMICPPSPPFTPPPAPFPEMIIPDTPRTRLKAREAKEITPPESPKEEKSNFLKVGGIKEEVQKAGESRKAEAKGEPMKTIKEEPKEQTNEATKEQTNEVAKEQDKREDEKEIHQGVERLGVKEPPIVTSPPIVPEPPTAPAQALPIPIIVAPSQLPQFLTPPSAARSDEGYLSGGDLDSEDEEQFVSSITSALHEDAAPLPEDIISAHAQPQGPRESERYQHHCIIHGHFFPKAGPLRSNGHPHEPFFPLISCDRCQRPRLSEAWQCALLNQCGIIVCTPCHDKLECRPAQAPVVEDGIDPLDAKAAGVRQGLELGVQRGIKIGFEVGLAGKAKEILERNERERRRGVKDLKVEDGLRVYRSWETRKEVRRMLSL